MSTACLSPKTSRMRPKLRRQRPQKQHHPRSARRTMASPRTRLKAECRSHPKSVRRGVRLVRRTLRQSRRLNLLARTRGRPLPERRTSQLSVLPHLQPRRSLKRSPTNRPLLLNKALLRHQSRISLRLTSHLLITWLALFLPISSQARAKHRHRLLPMLTFLVTCRMPALRRTVALKEMLIVRRIPRKMTARRQKRPKSPVVTQALPRLKSRLSQREPAFLRARAPLVAASSTVSQRAMTASLCEPPRQRHLLLRNLPQLIKRGTPAQPRSSSHRRQQAARSLASLMHPPPMEALFSRPRALLPQTYLVQLSRMLRLRRRRLRPRRTRMEASLTRRTTPSQPKSRCSKPNQAHLLASSHSVLFFSKNPPALHQKRPLDLLSRQPIFLGAPRKPLHRTHPTSLDLLQANPLDQNL